MDGTDYIAHMAFITNIPNSIKRPVESTYENIDMTAHLLNEATKAGVKKLFFHQQLRFMEITQFLGWKACQLIQLNLIVFKNYPVSFY